MRNSTIFSHFSQVFLVSLVSQANAYLSCRLSVLGLFYVISIFSQSLEHFKVVARYRVIISKKLQIPGKIANILPKNATFPEFQKAEYDCLHS